MDEDYIYKLQDRKEVRELRNRNCNRGHRRIREYAQLAHILQGGVGSLWNSVYSRIRHEIKDNKFHLVSHALDHEVAKKTRLINGQVYYEDVTYGRVWHLNHYRDKVVDGTWLPVGYSTMDYYIHPTKLTLEKVKRIRYKQPKYKNPDRIDIGQYQSLYRRNGIWYMKWINTEDHAKADEIVEYKLKEKYPYLKKSNAARKRYSWMKYDWFDDNYGMLSYSIKLSDWTKVESLEFNGVGIVTKVTNIAPRYKTIGVKVHTKQLNHEELSKYNLTNKTVTTISKRKLKHSLNKAAKSYVWI